MAAALGPLCAQKNNWQGLPQVPILPSSIIGIHLLYTVRTSPRLGALAFPHATCEKARFGKESEKSKVYPKRRLLK